MSTPAAAAPPTGHPEAWRRRLTSTEPGAVWVTYYQPDVGARVELSRATFDNWVAKAAGLLAEECDVETGSRVLVDLQPHWLLPVWAWAAWSLGATVLLPGATEAADVCVLDDAATIDESRCGQVLVSSRHPMALPEPTALPGGAVNAMAEIRGYPDVRADPIPPPGTELIADGHEVIAEGPGLDAVIGEVPMGRAAVLRSRPADAPALARALMGPQAHGGSLVIINGGSEADIAAIWAQERADITLD